MTALLINPGSQNQVLAEKALSSGTSTISFGIQTDAVLIGVVVKSITGTLTINVYTLVDGQESLLNSFPVISTATTSPLLFRSPIIPNQLLVRAVYTGPTDYSVSARAVGSIANIGDITIPATVTVSNFPATQPVSWVENTKQLIMKAQDRVATTTLADAGTKFQRITKIEYTSPALGPSIAVQTINYTAPGTKYQQALAPIWSII